MGRFDSQVRASLLMFLTDLVSQRPGIAVMIQAVEPPDRVFFGYGSVDTADPSEK